MLNGVVKDTIVTAIIVGAPILAVVLVVGLIIAAFVKKEPQVFDSQNSQE